MTNYPLQVNAWGFSFMFIFIKILFHVITNLVMNASRSENYL